MYFPSVRGCLPQNKGEREDVMPLVLVKVAEGFYKHTPQRESLDCPLELSSRWGWGGLSLSRWERKGKAGTEEQQQDRTQVSMRVFEAPKLGPSLILNTAPEAPSNGRILGLPRSRFTSQSLMHSSETNGS